MRQSDAGENTATAARIDSRLPTVHSPSIQGHVRRIVSSPGFRPIFRIGRALQLVAGDQTLNGSAVKIQDGCRAPPVPAVFLQDELQISPLQSPPCPGGQRSGLVVDAAMADAWPGWPGRSPAGRQSMVISPPEERATARRKAFSSSRTLPGNRARPSASLASRSQSRRRAGGFETAAGNDPVSSATSPARSRRGGIRC